MLSEQRIAERRPEPLILPARIRHHPIEVIEHAINQMARVALRWGQPGIDRQAVLGDEMGDDGIAVADRLAVVDDVGQLPAWRCRRIENVLVLERHAVKPQESEYLEAIAVVVGNTEKLGIGIEGNHRILHGTDGRAERRGSLLCCGARGSYWHKADIPRRLSICPLSGTKRTYPIMRLRPLRSLVTHSGHRPPLLILTGCKIVLFPDPRQFRYPCNQALAGGKSPLLRESRMLRRLL